MASNRSLADSLTDVGGLDTRATSALDTRMEPGRSSADQRVRNDASDAAKVREAISDPPEADDPSGLSESRLDPLSGDWTIFAAGRALRPDHMGCVTTPENAVTDCPFCQGREDQTPGPVWSQSVVSSHGVTPEPWSVRVVPNLYPAVMPPSGPRSSSLSNIPPPPANVQRGLALPRGLFVSEAAIGGHEVIIESARHTRSFSELNPAEIALVFKAYAERICHWRSVPGIRYVNVFKNVGRDAGASLQHAHSQLVAMNQLPTNVDRVTKRFQAHHARTGSCLQCDVVRAEVKQRDRVICQTPSLVAYCPYASRFPLLVRITSMQHISNIEDSDESMLGEISHLTLRVVRWLEAIRPGTAYNVLLYTAQPGFEGDLDSQHWALEILPRVTRLAGYELSSQGMINPIYPESAAIAYRNQARQSDPRHVLK